MSPKKSAWIVERYNPDQLWYADDVFTISHPWLQQLRGRAAARAALHLPFETITRADRLQSEAAVAGAARAGLLSHLDRLGERQPENPGRHGARRQRRAGAARRAARQRVTASGSACF